MKAALQWRWLIVDDIWMVSARLLADVDHTLRFFARGVDLYARNHKGVLRPFAGIHFSYSGDCWQLLPPDGGFLGDAPCEFIQARRKYIPAPPIVHGRSLPWSDSRIGMTVVTEFETCERNRDAWLKSVQ